MFHLKLLKTISYWLNYLGNLIFAAATFTKICLGLAEQVVGFGNVVEMISKQESALQESGNT